VTRGSAPTAVRRASRRAGATGLGAVDAARAVVARRRRRRAATDRRTLALGVVALSTAGGVAAGEVARVWQRGSAPLPTETEDVLGAAEEAARQTAEVALAGYQAGSRGEAALLVVLTSFTVSFGAVRATTHLIRSRGRLGPMRNLRLGHRHIHHFVPGIVLAFLAGGVSIVTRDERLDPWLAVPFGMGMALTLDESALLLEFDDVYWSERGVISVQITLGAVGVLSALVLALRALHRGEGRVLISTNHPSGPPSAAAPRLRAAPSASIAEPNGPGGPRPPG
jgi:hypothetical protein